ncbi:MAG: sulfatase-like hydrolase/transferase, partial [Mariniphaga sp.]|nr:sulfatase-like hydrolase/transferase [Mariniphaga sp.]
MKMFLIILLIVLPLFQTVGSERKDKENPNIIVIVADDLGNADVGYHDQGTEIPTPNIDKLAAAGVSFTSGYVMAPVCAPSRAALLTGRYQQSFGFVDNPGPFRASPEIVPGIPTSVKILPEYLKEHGYVTGMFGKWHVGGESGEDDYFPTKRGFDEFFGFIDGASNYFVEDNVKMTLFKQETPVDYESQYLTDALARETVDFMERHQNEKFFVYLPFNAVHGPLQAPDSLINKFSFVENASRRKLCAMQYSMDLAIGRVLNKLEELNLTENTLIFFVSDNGGKLNENYSYNTPYNGEKGTLYEGGIRLPFCIKWLGRIEESLVYDKPVCSMDIVPTILNIIGEEVSDSLKISGNNLLPYINGENENVPHNFLYWWLNNQWAVRDAEWKLLYNNGFSRPKLFNIVNDISEQNDLYGIYPEHVERLTNKYNEWRSSQMEIQWGWNSAIGEYVAHFQENFENIVKRYFAPMGNGVTTEIVKNPVIDGINKSQTVVKIIRPDENAQNWSGTYANVTQFQRKFRYLHLKILKSRKSQVRAKLKGKNMELEVFSTNSQSKINEWEDFVFDFNNFSGPINTINIQPDFEIGNYHEIYIDDIH